MTEKKQKKKKKLVIVSIALLLCIFLSACNPMSREIGTAGDWKEMIVRLKEMSPAELPGHISVEVSESLMIDAEIEIWDGLEDNVAGNLLLTQHIFDRKETADTLLKYIGNPEVLEIRDGGTESFMDNGSEIFRYNVDIGDNGFVQVRDNYFVLYRMDGRAINDIIGGYSEMQMLNPVEMMNRELELDFASREAVLRELESLFDELGIPMMGVNCYACTLEDLSREAEQITLQLEDPSFAERLEMMNLDAGKDDEAYILHYRQGYDEIPYCPYSLDVNITGSHWYMGAGCKAIYDAHGIIDMNAYSLFDLVEAQSPSQLLRFGEILEQYVTEQNDALAGKRITLVKAGLYYLPILTDADKLQYEAKPVWILLHDDEVLGRGGLRTICIYDAVTGERIQ